MAFLKVLGILLLGYASFGCSHPMQQNLPEVLLQRLAETKPASPQADDTNYRLPTHTIPISYNIELNPIVKEKEFTFEGKSTIQVKVLTETKTLTFHVNDIDITNAELTTKKDKKEETIDITDSQKEAKADFYTITFKQPLTPAEYTLKLAYTGNLNGDLRGFYRSNYTDDKGKSRWLAATHFEPIGARRAFPCWDEPAFKATFTISLKHPTDYMAVSNMPAIKEDNKVADKADNKIWTKFEITPEMSTYLVAFVVSDYGCKQHQKDKSFSVCTRKNALDSVDYALNFGKDALKKLEDYTGIPYNIPKMEQITIPHFSAGAMENWGLVTYKESSLLYKEGVTTTTQEQSIASVIAHEFAHQWFGDLVSPKWWSYIWLNEGFANYFQYVITDQVKENWRMMEQFVVKTLQGTAFVDDAKEDTRPMNRDINNPDDMKHLFDSISYHKSGSVIRMMSHILTEEVFQKGLKMYLKELSYKVATSDDLFKYLQQAADQANIKITDDKDVKFETIMNSWVTQKGYPVLSVVRDYEKNKAKITQQRFLQNTANVEDKTKYWVPVNYVAKDNADFNDTTPTHWLKPADEFLELDLTDVAKQWILLNKHQTGFYRVNYDEANWQLLINQLNSTDHYVIPSVNRAQLIDDALNLARSGRLPYSVALDLTTYLNKEVDYIPWVPAFSGFSFIDRVLKNSEHYPKFQLYMQRQVQKAMDGAGFEALKEHIPKLGRLDLMQWSCYYGYKPCNQYVTEQLQQWLGDSPKYQMPVDTKKVILCSALRQANEETWSRVFEKYKESKDKEEKRLLLSALGCSSSEQILTNYLSQALKNEKDIFEEPDDVFSVVYGNSAAGVSVVLDFVKNNLAEIQNATAPVKNLLKHITQIGKIITSEEQLYKLTTVIVDMNEPNEETHDAIDNAVTSMRLVKSHAPDIAKWLDENNFSIPSKEKEDKDDNSANAATLATALIVATLLMTRIY